MKRSWLDSRCRRGTCAGDSFVTMTAVTALSEVLEIGGLPVICGCCAGHPVTMHSIAISSTYYAILKRWKRIGPHRSSRQGSHSPSKVSPQRLHRGERRD